MRLANPLAVRWTPLSPLLEDSPSFTIRLIRQRPWDAACHGSCPWRCSRSSEQKAIAHEIMSLPMRLGGLGLRSAERMRPAAFWASWADALPMLSNRLPTLTDQVENELETGVGGTPCMLELSATTHTLDRSGFVDRGWHQLMGVSPRGCLFRTW